MVNLVRWEPIRDMMSLRQAMDRLFEDSFVRLPHLKVNGAVGFPIDVYQDDILTIKGEHKEEQETKEADYLYREHYYGAFSRSLALPIKVKGDKAEAAFDEGVLTLTMPKAEEAKPRQIKVKPKAEETKAKKAKK
jgi:HSP20 family protein